MLNDLISDLNLLKTELAVDKESIDESIKIAEECKKDLHTYLKFYGD